MSRIFGENKTLLKILRFLKKVKNLKVIELFLVSPSFKASKLSLNFLQSLIQGG